LSRRRKRSVAMRHPNAPLPGRGPAWTRAAVFVWAVTACGVVVVVGMIAGSHVVLGVLAAVLLIALLILSRHFLMGLVNLLARAMGEGRT